MLRLTAPPEALPPLPFSEFGPPAPKPAAPAWVRSPENVLLETDTAPLAT